MKTGDLIATVALLVIVAAVMIARFLRKQRPSVDRRALVEQFLRSHPGPVEIRPGRGTLADPIVVASPDADRILELLGQRGGEVWMVRSDHGPAFVRVPGWGDRR